MYYLSPSTRLDKKWMVRTPEGKIIHFGAKNYSDFLMHKNPEQRDRYISRHRPRENWTKSGINTAGFWAKHILWNLPSLSASIKDTEKKFNIKIIQK